jgi:hypothetical protein
MMNGLGSALTAKYSRKPLFHEKASFTERALSLMPFSSYKWKGVGYVLTISFICSSVTNVFFFTILMLLSGLLYDVTLKHGLFQHVKSAGI